MCGLAGIIRLEGRLSGSERHSVGRMLELTRHRGPDDSGVCGVSRNGLCVRGNAEEAGGEITALLGFNRLSIQDVSDAGKQPMLSADGKVVLTFNGEIYNTAELKKKLAEDFGAIEWRGHSDTEIVLQCYVRYGFEPMIHMLNGMFALVVADTEKGRIYIARDRYGIIPIHIMEDSGRIVYCSELKGFLGLEGFNRTPNVEAIAKNIIYYHPSDNFYRDVKSVEPGCYYEVSINAHRGGGIFTYHKYFDINNYRQDSSISSWHEAVERAGLVLRDCVERQLISDVSLGVMLSGGIDSTLVAKYASDSYSASGRTIQAFSLINSKYSKYSEEGYIDHAASRLKINLRKYDFTDEAFSENFARSVYASETFLGGPSMGVYEVMKHARKHVRVVLSGEGSDEISGGYADFSAAKGSELARRFLGRLSRKLARFGVIYDFRDFIRDFNRSLSEEACRRIFPAFSVEASLSEREKSGMKLTGSAFDKVRKLYFRERLPIILERQSKIFMYHTVESRVPFLDNAIVDLIFSLPEKYLIHPFWLRGIMQRNTRSLYEGKYIFKQISSGIYGDKFAFRPKSWIDFPLAEYITSPGFRDYIEREILPGMVSRGMFDMRRFYECMEDIHAPGNTMCVWRVLNAEMWLKIFADGRTPER